MKRKGVLKRMIAALCVGALISMPVTASAAEKEDVVGNWTGGPVGYTNFDENGMAEDKWNTKRYAMESGSLTVTFYSTNTTKTVDYDLWRGYQIKDVPDDENMDAVIYKIIEPGKKMMAWNVVKEAGSSEWFSYEPFILTKVTGDKKEDANSDVNSDTDSNYKCEHNYEWTVTTEPTETADGVNSYMCIYCGDIKERQSISANVIIRKELLDSIKNAEAGATVTFVNQAWLCYPQYVLDTLKEKGNVSLKTDFTYEGKNYSFIIPAGSDYANLEQADFYGFMYLFGAFGGVIVE